MLSLRLRHQTGEAYDLLPGFYLFHAIRSGVSRLSGELSWGHIVGEGLLGGIGFTMPIFITLLAFENPMTIQSTKISILLSSLVPGLIGDLVLRRQKTVPPNDPGST